MSTPGELAVAFNAAITAADPDALAALMADDHVFADSEGNQVTGRQACVAAWEGFFAAFPGYRNTFDEIRARPRPSCGAAPPGPATRS